MHPERERKCRLFLQALRNWPFHAPSNPLSLESDPIPALKLGLKELTHWDSSALNFISPSSVISECFYTTFQVNEISLQKRFSCVHCFQSLQKQIARMVRQVNVFSQKNLLEKLLNFILPCAADVGFPSLPLHLRHEPVNTNKVEGRQVPTTLTPTEVALFSDGDESTSSESPQKVAVGGIQGCGLGHWSEIMWVSWLHCNWPSNADVLDSRWCLWNQSVPFIWKSIFIALKPTYEKPLLSTGW